MSIRPLSTTLQELAKKNLHEVPERIPEDLNHIKQWLSKQKHLKCRTDDQWLVSFLRGCKYSIERTKEKLDMFYTLKTLIPDFYANRDPLDPDIQEVLKAGINLPLPETITPDGPKIYYFHWNPSNSKSITPLTILKVNLMILEILLLEDDKTVVNGICTWIDFHIFPVRISLQMSPVHLKKVMMCMQNSYPLRIKGVYHTNSPQIFENFLSLMKPLMSEKLRNRLFIYSTSSTETEFLKIFPLKFRPKQLGGENGCIEELTEYWRKKVESYRDYFIEDYQYHSIEELRPKKPRTCEDMFGIDGAFRKLDID